jgi:hypothetical protein
MERIDQVLISSRFTILTFAWKVDHKNPSQPQTVSSRRFEPGPPECEDLTSQA